MPFGVFTARKNVTYATGFSVGQYRSVQNRLFSQRYAETLRC